MCSLLRHRKECEARILSQVCWWSLRRGKAASVSLVGYCLKRDPREGNNEAQRCQGKSVPYPEQQQARHKMKTNSGRRAKERVGVAGAGSPGLMKQGLKSVKEPRDLGFYLSQGFF